MSIIDYLKENSQVCLGEDLNIESLEKWYDEFNMELFDGRLPKVPIFIFSRKGIGGQVRSTYNKRTGEIKIQGLDINSYYKKSDDNIKGVLIHEMVHIFFLNEGNVDEVHGPMFHRKLRELQKKTDIKIPLTDDVSNLELGDHVKLKKFDIFVFSHAKEQNVVSVLKNGFFDGKYFSMTSENNIRTNLDDLIERYDSKVLFNDYEIYFLRISDPMLMKYSVSSKLSTIKHFRITKEETTHLIQNGELILKLDKEELLKRKPSLAKYVK